MKINISYPSTVLFVENDDYVDSSFSTEDDLYESFGSIEIHTAFSWKDDMILERQGEQFLFYKANYSWSQELSKIPFLADNFTGCPSLLRQLNEDQIETVGQLLEELVILTKYENVGIGKVEKVFEQLKEKKIVSLSLWQ